MTKNIVIGILVLLLVAETGYLLVKRQSYHQQIAALMVSKKQNSFPPVGPAKGAKLVILSKGANLKTSPLFHFAYEIAPTMSDAAKTHVTGFSIVSKTQADGSLLVTLTPKDSTDQSQQYTVQKGQTLYFIEQTPFDDKTNSDTDLNYRDDYGVITDANGIVQ